MRVKSESEVTQSCPTLSDPMDCSLPGSSVHGIFQARVLEWGAITFSISLGSLIIEGMFHHYRDMNGPRDLSEKAVVTHYSTLVWKIPWMEEPCRLQSMGSLRVGYD